LETRIFVVKYNSNIGLNLNLWKVWKAMSLPSYFSRKDIEKV